MVKKQERRLFPVSNHTMEKETRVLDECLQDRNSSSFHLFPYATSIFKKEVSGMLRSILHKYSLPVFASAGGAAALLLLYQRAALALANRRGDSAPHTIYHTPDGVSVT